MSPKWSNHFSSPDPTATQQWHKELQDKYIEELEVKNMLEN